MGVRAPNWQGADLDNRVRRTPNLEGWQVLVFVDHSIREFPGVVDGLMELLTADSLEVLLVTRANPELVRQMAEILDLRTPIVHVDDHFYRDFNVRVMPYAMFLDPAGIVRAGGLVNYRETLLKMWSIARVPIGGSENLADPLVAARSIESRGL